MSEYHFPIPGNDPNNQIVLFIRKHWAAFLNQFILSAILALIPIVILIAIHFLGTAKIRGVEINLLVLFLSTYYLIIATFIFVGWLSFYYNVYIITKTEIIEISQEGFFGRKISQLSLLRVQDVTSIIEGFLPTLFGYGNVLVETAGERSQNFLICGIPNPQEVSNQILELHDQIIEIEGRHHQILEGEGLLVSKEPEKTPESEIEPQKEPATSYQELLKKEKEKSEDKKDEGEIDRDDLNQGGEIDLK